MLVKHKKLIELTLLIITYASFLAAASNLPTLWQPLELKPRAVESFTGHMHRFFSKGRHSQEMLEVLSANGHQLASFNCSLIAEPCTTLEGHGIVTVIAVSSFQGFLIPINIQRGDMTPVIGVERQMQHLESERIFQRNVVLLSTSTFIVFTALWTFLRTRLWPGASYF